MITVALSASFERAAQRLSREDRTRIGDFFLKLMTGAATAGLHLEAVRGASAGVLSGRVSDDLRAILYREGAAFVLLHVDRHDAAYRWAAGRRIERHAVTNVLQVIEAPGAPAPVPSVAHPAPRPPGLLAGRSDEYLMSLGVPRDWLPVLREAASDDELLRVASKLPDEVQDALLALASGEPVTPPPPAKTDAPLAPHAGLGHRFHMVKDAAELEEILAQPLAAWVRYVHPTQRRLIDGCFSGPIKVTGSAGTGKTVVAMHRAARLAREGKRVLLTSFVTTLCHNTAHNLKLLCGAQELARIAVRTVHQTALETCARAGHAFEPAGEKRTRECLAAARSAAASSMDEAFLAAELEHVVLLRGLRSWEEYRDVSRAGRGRPLSIRQRKEVWQVLGRVLQELLAAGTPPWALLARAAREALETGKAESPFDAVVVDELQDLGPEEIRFLTALCRDCRDLILIGDAGQRIYRTALNLKALGVDVRGRSHVLRINYRTTEQIRCAADRLLGDETDDLAGGRESRRARSLLSGPEPAFAGFGSEDAQCRFVAGRIRELEAQGIALSEIGVFTPFNEQRDVLAGGLRAAGIAVHVLGPSDDLAGSAGVRAGTMHRAKGLEFKAVFAAHCSANFMPAPFVKHIDDAADREAAELQQRQLLYVVMTRARDLLAVSWVGSPSPFLQDLGVAG